MAFNLDSFRKETSKAILSRVVDSVVTDSITGKPASATSVARALANELTIAGSSVINTAVLTNLRTDSIISAADSIYFGGINSTLNRVANRTLESIRRTGQENINTYLKDINPTTKIASSKNSKAINIHTVL